MRKVWQAGDVVDLDLDIDAHLLTCDPHVNENRGSVALRRGPFVYCAEGIDQPDIDLGTVALDAIQETEWHKELLGGIVMVSAQASVTAWEQPLYHRVDRTPAPRTPVALTLVPYFAWANRGVAPMTVWLQDGRPTGASPERS